MASDHGSHRSDSTSGSAILAAFIPTFVAAVIYVSIFAAIRNSYRKIYAPRTFLGTVEAKDRTPAERASGSHWFHGFRTLSDKFVLQHNSLDAYLYLRYLRSIIWICFIGCCLTWPILFPINAKGGGRASQLDKISLSNVVKKDYLWAHVSIAWVFFLGIIVYLARERLRLIGIRQAYFVNDEYASRLSARTVLWLNAPREACQPEKMKDYFGNDAEKLWAARDLGDLNGLVAQRNGMAYALERAEMDLIITGAKLQKAQGPATINGQTEAQQTVPAAKRPTKREPPVVGKKFDILDKTRDRITKLNNTIETHRAAPSRNVPDQSAVFVSFNSQPAAHRAYQQISFQSRLPMEDRFLAPRPKEVLWENIAMPVKERLSKASIALVFVVVFTIFFSIPTGIIGTISNAKYLADRISWLSWINNLPPWLLGLLTGLLPPFLVSWLVSYVPKLFRHIAKLSGEPTTSQAELKAQAWYFAFQVVQIFLVTTFSSGAAAVATQIAKDPKSAPSLLAESLPKASNFYLTYFILQGLTKSSDDLLNYSDLFTYLFYEKFWNKTPREHFDTHADMKGTPWASWFPKFTNLFVIAIVYACIAPLVLGFATVGISILYLSYRYNLLYVCQTKVDTKGEAYKRALQQVPTGIYLAELCLIGLMGAQKAPVQATSMTVLLILTAIINLILDRMLKPLEVYLGVDIWQEQEVPLLAEEDGIDPNDESALHGASHARRLGLKKLPDPAPRILSDFFDSIIAQSRNQAKNWLSDPSVARGEDAEPLKAEDLEKAYLAPALTSGMPKLWIPSDKAGTARQEAELNAAAGMPTTTEGAEIDEEGKLHWDHDFEHVPIWKKAQNV
ncbi:hypothetical protein B0A50_04834 [Salinomyces thailandicus]|uniref:DUF221-domain-containing protein n=1 Tax=Salinomyces thailandicus TaxID=706561 RepID=A0A4U0TYV6_9PEZI|nr:hypothetical protein B0A50_04834 [Salinomyces thailandica]